MEKREKMLARLRAIGSKGGKAVVAKYGTKYMRDIASKGGKKTWAKDEDITNNHD